MTCVRRYDVDLMSQRTQVYLDPNDHQRLRRLAADRRRSMTDLVREALARYLAEESGTDLPSLEEIATALHDEPRYLGTPPGPSGLVERMRIREGAAAPQGRHDAKSEDAAIGRALSDEHDQHVEAWHRRRSASP